MYTRIYEEKACCAGCARGLRVATSGYAIRRERARRAHASGGAGEPAAVAGEPAGAGAVAGAGAGHGAGMGVVDAGAPALAKTWASSPVAPPLFLYLAGLA